jgi:hypothetical protein
MVTTMVILSVMMVMVTVTLIVMAMTLIVMAMAIVMATPRARLTALEWAAESEMMDEMMLVAEMGLGTRT